MLSSIEFYSLQT